MTAAPLLAANSAAAGTSASSRHNHTKASAKRESGSTGAVEPSITIVEFSDFACPYCSKMVPVIDDLLKAYPGQVQVIVKDFPLPIHPGSELAHEACLAAKAQGKYWEMYHLLYADQRHLEKSDLLADARHLHLDVPRFQRALDSHEYRSAVRDSVAEGRALGVNATPTFFLNGEKLSGVQSFDFLKGQVQAALDGTLPQRPGTDSKREEMVAANSPVRGSPDAPVTIVEYADFQCPFCASAEKSVALLLREYPGKVNIVFKNFPLDFHADSMLAHRAALAAGEQGKFWEMHDLIFSQQRAIKHDDLFAMAKTLGLDMDRFAKDLDSEKVQAEIDSDRAEGRRAGVEGTPTFYVDGAEITGAANLPRFEAMIGNSLRAKGIEPTKVPQMADGGPSRGPEHAAITVLWYSDVTSPLAVSASNLIDRVLEAHPGDVRVIFKNRPLEFHPGAMLAHEALMAAAAQGKFWAMHRILLAHQNALQAQDLVDYAGQIGLDTQKFYSDITARTYRAQVEKDVAQARDSGVNGVPVFFINGERVDGVQSLSSFTAILDEQIQRGRVAAVRE